jgi:hypothetical protein
MSSRRPYGSWLASRIGRDYPDCLCYALYFRTPTCPAPAARARPAVPTPAADLAEITRIYGIRHWTEQGYKQVKDELGWADFPLIGAPIPLMLK